MDNNNPKVQKPKMKRQMSPYMTKQRMAVSLLPPPQTRYTEQEICKCAEDNYGNISQMALELECSYQQLFLYFKETPEREKFLADCKQKIADIGERRLVTLMNSADERVALDATKFALARLGKSRGWADSPAIAIQQAIVADDKRVKILNIFGIPDDQQLSAV